MEELLAKKRLYFSPPQKSIGIVLGIILGAHSRIFVRFTPKK